MARGPVLVLLVLGFIRVSAVATLPPRPEADLADHAGARVLRRAAFVLWERLLDGVRRGRALALPADAELMAQAGGRHQTLDRRGLWPSLSETAPPLSYLDRRTEQL